MIEHIYSWLRVVYATNQQQLSALRNNDESRTKFSENMTCTVTVRRARCKTGLRAQWTCALATIPIAPLTSYQVEDSMFAVRSFCSCFPLLLLIPPLCFSQGPTGLGFAIGEGLRAQDGEQGIFIRNITEGGTAYKVRHLKSFTVPSISLFPLSAFC